jgi:hypothetical protein
VVGFTPPTDSLDGQHMWVSTDVAERYRPSPDILREHFRQCILANVKGAGRQGLDDEAWDPEVDIDLQNTERWSHGTGRERLRMEMRARLEGLG